MRRRTLLTSLPMLAAAASREPRARAGGAAQRPSSVLTLGVQYYRAPFPEQRHWAEDLRRIRDAGLDTLQLWVMWPWVESRPGRFDFDDYDRLVSLAHEVGLDIIVSTIAEVHPHWIHRVVRDSEMIDHLGNRVISSLRAESNFGLTPGGCFDHPGVWARQRRFIEATVTRYRDAPHLTAWDIWNETRWDVQADNLVCFCPHTLRAFRSHLRATYGDLDRLNRAWNRRYSSWDEVAPGKLPKRPYTEMMAWTRFITARANRHAEQRHRLVHALDPRHPATLHGPSSCTGHQGNIAHPSYPLARGNDWGFADVTDGVGASIFPTWWKLDDAAVAAMATHVRSAARGKRAWFSEVQGGRAAQGAEPHDAVEPWQQQRWIWNAFASGIDTVLFWCWRDEVFGGESSGFGIVGHDGLAQGRIEAMRRTAGLMKRHADVLRGYRPTTAQVGVLFSPLSYHLLWAQSGAGYPARYALEGYARALTQLSIPWVTVEEAHLRPTLDGLSVLILPRTMVTTPALEEALTAFVSRGGTLVTEPECGAYTSEGFWRPPEDRFLARFAGLREVGRRPLVGDAIELALGAEPVTVPAAQWSCPFEAPNARAWATHADGLLAAEIRVGQGRIFALGAYLAEATRDRPGAAFRQLISRCLTIAGVEPAVRVMRPTDGAAFVRTGAGEGGPIALVLAPTGTGAVALAVRANVFKNGRVRDLWTDRTFELAANGRGEATLQLPRLDAGLAILTDG